MIEAAYQKYLKLTGDPAAAATLVLAEVVSGRPSDGDLLTVKEAAKRLNVNPDKVYGMCNLGELKHRRVGNRIRIRPEDLDGARTKTEDRRIAELEKCFQ